MSKLFSGDKILIDGELATVAYNQSDFDLTKSVLKQLRNPNVIKDVDLSIGPYVGLELNVNGDIKIIEKIVHKDNNLCDVYFVDPYKPRNTIEDLLKSVIIFQNQEKNNLTKILFDKDKK